MSSASTSIFRSTNDPRQAVLNRNTNRLGAILYNDPSTGGGSVMRVLITDAPSQINAFNFSIKLYPTQYYIVDFDYTGAIYVAWETGDVTSFCAVTEFI